MTNVILKYPEKYLPIFLLLAFIIKLILLPFAQVTDADAVTRTLITLNWMEHPYWMDTAIWAPFHFYYNSIALYIWNNPMYSPVLLNVFFSILTLIPFYHFVKREFNSTGALFATFFLFVSPLLFRTSFLALAETPFLFFVILSLNLISKSIKENKKGMVILAGISMTLASGFRYEGWILIGIFALTISLFKEWKKAILFGIFAFIFPMIWLWSNFQATGDAFISFKGNSHYTLQLIGTNDNPSFESYLRRIWFFPFSLWISIGPPVFYFCFRHFIKTYQKAENKKWIWTIPFWMTLAFYFYYSLTGTLLLHHRFTGLLTVFALPFIAGYFEQWSGTSIHKAFVFATFTIGLTFVYNMHGLTPLPRLKNQDIVKISKVVKQELESDSGLILDFLNWENSYFIALDAAIRPKQIIFMPGEKHAELPIHDCIRILNERGNGVIVILKNSELDKMVMDEKSPISILMNEKHHSVSIFDDAEFRMIKWKKK